jgi:hypothetical protein
MIIEMKIDEKIMEDEIITEVEIITQIDQAEVVD